MMKNLFEKKQLLAAVAGFVLFVPLAVNAVMPNTDLQTRNTSIAVSDLNLSRQEGIETLYQRLKQAAGNVCGPETSHGVGPRIVPLSVKKQYRECVDKALDEAVRSINNESLTKLHRQ